MVDNPLATYARSANGRSTLRERRSHDERLKPGADIKRRAIPARASSIATFIPPLKSTADLNPFLSDHWWKHYDTYGSFVSPGFSTYAALSAHAAGHRAPRRVAAERRAARHPTSTSCARSISIPTHRAWYSASAAHRRLRPAQSRFRCGAVHRRSTTGSFMPGSSGAAPESLDLRAAGFPGSRRSRNREARRRPALRADHHRRFAPQPLGIGATGRCSRPRRPRISPSACTSAASRARRYRRRLAVVLLRAPLFQLPGDGDGAHQSRDGRRVRALSELRIVLVEAGFAWVPSLCWRLDQHWARMRDEVPHVKRPPSEYIRENVWYTTQPIEEPANPDICGT